MIRLLRTNSSVTEAIYKSAEGVGARCCRVGTQMQEGTRARSSGATEGMQTQAALYVSGDSPKTCDNHPSAMVLQGCASPPQEPKPDCTHPNRPAPPPRASTEHPIPPPPQPRAAATSRRRNPAPPQPRASAPKAALAAPPRRRRLAAR